MNAAVTINVLANDVDPDGDQMTVDSLLVLPENGAAVINSDSTITYTPNQDFVGSDSFMYQVTDGRETNGATVSVTVTETSMSNTPPVAEDDFAETEMDTDVSIDVLANDFDDDVDDIFVDSIDTFPEGGDVEINEDGTITYTPFEGFVGEDSFVYVISDGNGVTDDATVTVTVTEPATTANSPPGAEDDFAQTSQNIPIIIGVLANDDDPDGDALTVDSITMPPSNGMVVINPDYTITYMADLGFSGSDSFGYMVSDGKGGTDTALVSITVNEFASPIPIPISILPLP